MIYVTDEFDLVPELFEAYPEIVKSETATVDILPVMADIGQNPSSNFTVFIQPEPHMQDNHVIYANKIKTRPNHVFAVSGFSHNKDRDWQQPYVLNFSNLTMTVRVNKDIPAVSLGQKEYAGTLLLGGASTNRTILLNEIYVSGHWDKFLINYFRRSAHTDLSDNYRLDHLFYRTPILNQLDNAEFMETTFDKDLWGNSCRPSKLSVHGQHHWVSQFIPYNVYNLAYISVIAETEVAPGCFFVSEKIAKPLLLGQPFVVFSDKNYLEGLKELGFKTFDPWIDESYDKIDSISDRAKAVAQSAIKFCNLPDQEKQQIMQELQPIVQHNRRLVLDKKFTMKTIADAIINFSTNSNKV